MYLDNDDYFDFATKDELSEVYSPKKRQCPNCSKPIPTDSLFCLYCGEPVSLGKKKGWLILLVLFVLLAFVLWVLIL